MKKLTFPLHVSEQGVSAKVRQIARIKKTIQNRPAKCTRLLRARKFDSDPVWKVPPWAGEWAPVKPLSAEVKAEAEARAREMRLYALATQVARVLPIARSCLVKF